MATEMLGHHQCSVSGTLCVQQSTMRGAEHMFLHLGGQWQGMFCIRDCWLWFWPAACRRAMAGHVLQQRLLAMPVACSLS